MTFCSYLTIDESLDLIQSHIDESDSLKVSAKRILENHIEAGSIIPLFKFNGFGICYKYKAFGEGKGSVEIKQISKIHGYFIETSSLYPSDHFSYVFFANLDEIDYLIPEALLSETLTSTFIEAHCRVWGGDEGGDYYRRVSDEELFTLGDEERITLCSNFPSINNDLSIYNHQQAHITKKDVYFKIEEVERLILSLNQTNNTKALQSQSAATNAEIDELRKKVVELTAENDDLKKQLSSTIDTPPNEIIDEGQGDSLLVLGAVMLCIKEAAKKNFTQELLTQTILDKYKNVSGISESTLKKKYTEAKNHLKQRHTL